MTTTATIAAKGCKSTGLTEQIASNLHDNLGRTVVAVVELSSEARTETRNGDEKVKLVINMIEVAPEGLAADHVRELARSFHYERQLADGQLKIETGDDIEPKVADVLAAGQRHRPHPYLSSQLGVDDTAVCDVCGHHEGAAVHADRTALADPFASAGEADADLDDEDDHQGTADADPTEDDPAA